MQMPGRCTPLHPTSRVGEGGGSLHGGDLGRLAATRKREREVVIICGYIRMLD